MDAQRSYVINAQWNVTLLGTPYGSTFGTISETKSLKKTTAESRVLFPSGKAIEIHRSFPPNFSGRKNSNFYKHPP